MYGKGTMIEKNTELLQQRFTSNSKRLCCSTFEGTITTQCDNNNVTMTKRRQKHDNNNAAMTTTRRRECEDENVTTTTRQRQHDCDNATTTTTLRRRSRCCQRARTEVGDHNRTRASILAPVNLTGTHESRRKEPYTGEHSEAGKF